jgi:hypothetical protein
MATYYVARELIALGHDVKQVPATAMEDRQSARRHNQAATRPARDRRNGAFNFVWLAHRYPTTHCNCLVFGE